MAIYKNVASQKLAVFAYTPADGAAKTGDAANITAYLSKDWAAPSAITDANPTELDSANMPGWYVFDLTQAETNAEVLIVAPKSATTGVVLDQVQVFTLDATISSRASQASVDDVPTNAELAARTLLAADYFDPAADTVANVTTVGSVTGAVGSVTGNVGGNVAGSVASVTAGVTVTTNNDKTGYALTAAYDAAKTAAQAGDAMTLTAAYDAAKTAAQAGDAMTLTAAYDAAKTAAQAGDAMTLTAAYDAAKTAAQAGDEMDLVDAPNAVAVAAIQFGLATSLDIAALNNVSAGEVADAVWDELLAGHAGAGTAGAALSAATAPTAGDVADAVWDEVLADHLGAGSTGAGLNAAGSAGDPWATALPGDYGAGSAGNILGNRLDAAVSGRAPANEYDAVLDAAISSRLAGASYTAPDNAALTTLLDRLTAARAGYLDKLNVTGTLAHSDAANTYKADVSGVATQAAIDALDTLIDAVKAQTDLLPPDPAGVSDLPDVSGLATSAELTALHDLSAADVRAQADAALAAYDAATSAELTTAVSGLAAETTAQSIKAKTDQLTFTTPNKVDASAEVTVDAEAIAEAVAEVVGETVAAEVWEHTPRTLTQSAIVPGPTTTAGEITRRRGDDWEIAITGLSLAGYTEVWFTIKRGYEALDTAAMLQVKQTTGLVRLNGAAPAAGEAVKASLAVNGTNDTATITAEAAITAQLPTGQFDYDLQWKDASNDIYTVSLGTFTISGDVTRATS